MINLNIETHYLKNQNDIAEYLVQSMFIHYGIGKIAVVTSRPKTLAQKTSSKWQGSFNDPTMSLRFSSQPPEGLLDADVTFATLKNFLAVPPICELLYVTYPVEKQDLYMVTSWMLSGSTVILYSFKP